MLKTDKTVYQNILILNLALMAIALILSVYAIFGKDVTVLRILSNVANVATLVFGTFYIFKGYRKDAAKFYKIFGGLFALGQLLFVISGIFSELSLALILGYVLTFCVILILLFVKNLGKTISLILCGVLIVLTIYCGVISIVGGYPLVSILIKFVNFDIAIVYTIFTYAKYLDKTERGTK